jgi:molybdenum cofactor biosynthesis enzyme MoaA
MSKLIWKLDNMLQTSGITPAQLEREIIRLGYEFGAKTIYRFTGGGPTNLNRGSLEAIISALRSLTRQDVNVQDLLEYREER